VATTYTEEHGVRSGLPAAKEFQGGAMEEGSHRFNYGLEKKQRHNQLQSVGKMGTRRRAWSI
jgi:hypothetical protein